MYIATVHSLRRCARKQGCRGQPEHTAYHQCSFQRPSVLRTNRTTCWASTTYPVETEAVLARLRGSILLYDELVPLNGKDSIALHVWRLIKQLPLKDRVKLLDLPPKGFRRLWKLSGGLFRCSDVDLVATLGSWSLADDFPDENDTGTCRYLRGVVHQRHFGIVHKQTAFFSNCEGDIVGLVQRRKWHKPWQVQTESYSIDASPGLAVLDTQEPVLLTASQADASTKVQRAEFFRCAGPGVYVGYATEYGNAGIQGALGVCSIVTTSVHEHLSQQLRLLHLYHQHVVMV